MRTDDPKSPLQAFKSYARLIVEFGMSVPSPLAFKPFRADVGKRIMIFKILTQRVSTDPRAFFGA